MARRDLVAASVLLLFAAAAASESLRTLPLGVVRNPGPGFYPWWVSLTLCVLALVLLVQSLRARTAPGPAEERGQFLRVAGVLAVLALYSLALDTVGYPLATFAVVLFMLRVTEPHPWLVALSFAVLTAGGSYLLFAVWLAVPLPAGPFAR